KAPADAVASELLDHRESGAFGMGLHSARDITDAIAGAALLDTLIERLARHPKQLLGAFGYLADRHGARRIAIKTFIYNAKVQTDDIALLQLTARRNPVNDFLVDRDTQRLGIRHVAGPVSLEGWFCALLVGQLFRQFVEFAGGDTRTHRCREFLEDLRDYS